MRNTIIFTAILFVAVIAATIYYFKNLDKEHNSAAKPLRYLPNNTLLIASLSNNEITDNIFKDFEVFDALLGFKNMDKLTFLKNQVLRNEELSKYVKDTDIYFSFHAENKKTEMILTIPMTTPFAAGELPVTLNNLRNKYKITERDTLGRTIYTLRYGEKDSVLYSTYFQNIFFASTSEKLISKILDKNTKHLPDEQINFFLKSHSRNTPFSVYFPHQQYDTIVDLYQRRSNGIFLNLFKKMQGQSAWNINFKQDALILTGESQLDQYSENYISLFKNQHKTTHYLYNYFPSNTAVSIEYSISNRSKFHKDLKDLFKRRKESIAQEVDTTDLTANIEKALGSDFAFIETVASNYLGFIRVGDLQMWDKLKSQILDNTTDSIYRFKSSNLLYKHFGDAFKELPRPYIVQVDSILVFANNQGSLKAFQDDWKNKNLLTGTLGFKNFEKLQGNEANVTFFVHAKNANSKILNSLTSPFQDNFKNTEAFGFQDFYSWSIQLSGNDGKFSSQIYAIYKSKNALGVTSDWTYAFDNKTITKPYVFEHSDTSKFILIQELDHRIHAIHPSGQKMWSSVFAGRVVGDMQQLTDRTIVLATDKGYLYRFDTDGKAAKGFSVEMPYKPIATPTIANLGNKKAILIPAKNQVLAYDLDGQRIAEWEVSDLTVTIVGPVLSIGQQFAVGSTNGKIILMNAKGQKIKELVLENATEVKNPIALYTDASNTLQFLMVDTTSNLYKIPVDKPFVKYSFEKATGSFMADFNPIIGNKAPEMIIMNNSHLQVFNITDTVRLLFEHHFTKDITDRPQYFESQSDKGHSLFGIASKATNLIYIFEENGSVVEGFPVEGQPLFHYGSISYKNETYLLVMRRDHKLYAFRHQK